MLVENNVHYQYIIEEVRKSGFVPDKSNDDKGLHVMVNDKGYRVVLNSRSMTCDVYYNDKLISEPAIGYSQPRTMTT